MSKSLLRLAILSAPLVLTACGEGWEVQKVSNYGTYEGRTAGTGVAYVRAKMLPKKELVAEPVMEEIKAEEEAKVEEAVKPMEEPAPALKAEKIFTEAQQKGVAHNKVAEEEEHSALESEESDELLTPMPEEEEEHSSIMMNYTGEKMTAEDYIAQAPDSIIAPKVEVIKMDSYEQAQDDGDGSVQLLKTAGIDASDLEDDGDVYETEVVHPQKHIIVPKKDMGAYLSVGEEELSQIYNQPF